MDSTACHVIYVNRSVSHDRFIPARLDGDAADDSSDEQTDHVRQDIKPVLEAFGDGMPQSSYARLAMIACLPVLFCFNSFRLFYRLSLSRTSSYSSRGCGQLHIARHHINRHATQRANTSCTRFFVSRLANCLLDFRYCGGI